MDFEETQGLYQTSILAMSHGNLPDNSRQNSIFVRGQNSNTQLPQAQGTLSGTDESRGGAVPKAKGDRKSYSRDRGSTPSASSKISGFSTLTPFRDSTNVQARF